MHRTVRGVLAGFAFLFAATAGSAASIDFRSGGPSVFDDGAGISVEVTAWAGENPQDVIDPSDPGASGLTPLETVVDARDGVGCGSGLMFCGDLGNPPGTSNDALLFRFDSAVTLSGVTIGQFYDRSVVAAFSWNGSSWDELARIDTFNCPLIDPGLMCVITGQPLLGAVDETQHLLIASFGGGDGFTVIEFEDVVAVPEPGSAALLALGLSGLALRRPRSAHAAVVHSD